VLGFVTPQSFRGDQIAAGVVVLTVLTGLLVVRLEDVGSGGRLAIAALTFAFVTALAWRSPTEASSPRAYQVALYVCSWALLALSLFELVELLDIDLLEEAGTAFWTSAVLSAMAGVWSRVRDTAAMTLLAAITGTGAVLAAADWLGDPGASANRWLLLGCAVVLALWALARRDGHPVHAAQLANAAGAAIVVMFATELFNVYFLGAFEDSGPDLALGTGWELVGVAAGFGLVAYGAVDEHRGPVIVGIVLLVLWVVTAGADGGLFGWPLVLAAVAAFMLIVGLRPTTPMPPPPDRLDEPVEPLPLPRLRREG